MVGDTNAFASWLVLCFGVCEDSNLSSAGDAPPGECASPRGETPGIPSPAMRRTAEFLVDDSGGGTCGASSSDMRNPLALVRCSSADSIEPVTSLPAAKKSTSADLTRMAPDGGTSSREADDVGESGAVFA